jgi:ATP-dependent exoDNAse (exonuclease V) beta subunit
LQCLHAAPAEKEQLLNHWRVAVEERQAQALRALTSDAVWSNALDVLRQNEPRNGEDIAAQRRAKILESASKVLDASLSVAERLQAVCEMDSHINRQGGAQKNWHSKEALAAVKDAFKQLHKVCEPLAAQVGNLRPTDADAHAAELALAFAQELRLALDAYDRAKRERSVLDFDDLQLRVRDLLRHHPDVREAYRRRFKFIMVDEFQDTNALQKEILWTVAGREMKDEGLGMRDEATHPSSRLFIVGDIKQGIYRFRGADVSVFNETAEEFKRDLDCRTLELNTNFRTQSGLVDFFNTVFSHPAVMGSAGKALYEAAYAPLNAHRTDEAHRCDATAGPHVEFLLVKPREQESMGQRVNESMKDMAALRKVEAHAIAQRIKNLGDDSVRYGDVALLFAAMTDVAIYENALRAHDVPYYVVAGSGLYRRQEVKDVLNFLKVLENVHDDIALVGVLRSPFFAVSDETLYWLCHPQGRGSLYERMSNVQCPMSNDSSVHHEEQDKLRRAAQLIAALREVKNRLRPSQLLNLILERTGFTAVLLTQFMGEQMASNVRKVVDLARSLEVGNGHRAVSSLQDFITRLNEFINAEQRESEAATQEEESNVVKLLTVHRAKGLEWSVVFVPDLARSRRPSNDTLLSHPRYGFVPKVENEEGKLTDPAIAALIRDEENRREIAEHRRLLYVAATRARDRLILSSPFKLQRETWLHWLNEAMGGLESMRTSCPRQWGNESMAQDGSSACRAVVRWVDEKPAQRTPELVRDSSSLSPQQVEASVSHPSSLIMDEDRLRRQIQPIPVHVASKRFFSVEELCAYVRCPQKYFLAHLRRLPESTGHRVNGSMGSLQSDELAWCIVRKAMVADAALVEYLQRVVNRFLQSDLGRRLSAMSLQCNVPFSLKCGDAIVEGVIDLLGVDEEGKAHVAQLKTVSPRHSADEAAHRFEIGLLCEAVNTARRGDFSRSASLYYVEDRHEESIAPSEFAWNTVENIIAQIRRAAFDRRDDAPCAACEHRWACGQRTGVPLSVSDLKAEG